MAADTHLPNESAQRVDPRTIGVWRWAALAAWAPLLAAGLLGTIAATLARSPLVVAVWAALAFALGLLAFTVWWYPPARYRRLGYRLDDAGITIQDGVFWRTQSALPRVRIQHTDVSQGPLQRRYGVATLKLYTAGSRFTRIELPGLEYGAAVALRDRLQQAGGDDAV